MLYNAYTDYICLEIHDLIHAFDHLSLHNFFCSVNSHHPVHVQKKSWAPLLLLWFWYWLLWKCIVHQSISMYLFGTVWGGRLWKMFCNMFSESSLCLLGLHGRCSSAQLPVENILQNLLHNLPPQIVDSSQSTCLGLDWLIRSFSMRLYSKVPLS